METHAEVAWSSNSLWISLIVEHFDWTLYDCPTGFFSNPIYFNQKYDCKVKSINTFHITLLIKLIILSYFDRCWSGKVSVFCQTLHSWDKSSGDVNKINKRYQFATDNYVSNHFQTVKWCSMNRYVVLQKSFLLCLYELVWLLCEFFR